MLQLEFKPFPEFKTERLSLRRLTLSDAPALYLLRSNEKVMQYMDVPWAKSVEDMQKRIESFDAELIEKRSVNWGIRVPDNEEIIGTICIWNIDRRNHRGEIGYLLMPAYQGRGLASEAIQTVLDYGFNVLQLHTIEGRVSPDNQASIKVLERNGFKQEAYFRENYYYDGRFLDTIVFSLINPGREESEETQP